MTCVYIKIGYGKKLYSQYLSNMYVNLYLALKYILCDSREYAMGMELMKSSEAYNKN